MSEASPNGAGTKKSVESVKGLETWTTRADSAKYFGKTVTVFDAKTGRKLLTGVVSGYTDLLASDGILVPDPERGFNNVLAAIRFPRNPVDYSEEMSRYRFRVEP